MHDFILTHNGSSHKCVFPSAVSDFRRADYRNWMMYKLKGAYFRTNDEVVIAEHSATGGYLTIGRPKQSPGTMVKVELGKPAAHVRYHYLLGKLDNLDQVYIFLLSNGLLLFQRFIYGGPNYDDRPETGDFIEYPAAQLLRGPKVAVETDDDGSLGGIEDDEGLGVDPP